MKRRGGDFVLRDFFEQLFGFKENNYLSTRQQFQCEENTLISPNGNYTMGKFECPTLHGLRMAVQFNDIKKGEVTFTHISTPDVIILHNQVENNKATFQVASQFNCLEMINPDVKPEEGITIYAEDQSQGPPCAIACAPATVYRNYFAFIDEGQEGQTRQKQINNLDDLAKELSETNVTEDFFRLKNGYTTSTSEKILNLNCRINQLLESNPETLDRLRSLIKVGVVSKAEVVINKKPDGFYNVVPISKRNIVTQVFCSAISANSEMGEEIEIEDYDVLGRLVLDAAYEATLLAAIKDAKLNDDDNPRVFLTLVGGGVFMNPREWIVNAITRAIHNIKKMGYKLEVNIVHYLGIDEYYSRIMDAYDYTTYDIVMQNQDELIKEKVKMAEVLKQCGKMKAGQILALIEKKNTVEEVRALRDEVLNLIQKLRGLGILDKDIKEVIAKKNKENKYITVEQCDTLIDDLIVKLGEEQAVTVLQNHKNLGDCEDCMLLPFTCGHCTLMNPAGKRQCNACGFDRPAAAEEKADVHAQAHAQAHAPAPAPEEIKIVFDSTSGLYDNNYDNNTIYYTGGRLVNIHNTKHYFIQQVFKKFVESPLGEKVYLGKDTNEAGWSPNIVQKDNALYYDGKHEIIAVNLTEVNLTDLQEKIKRITEMGFSEDKVPKALQQNNYSISEAVDWLAAAHQTS